MKLTVPESRGSWDQFLGGPYLPVSKPAHEVLVLMVPRRLNGCHRTRPCNWNYYLGSKSQKRNTPDRCCSSAHHVPDMNWDIYWAEMECVTHCSWAQLTHTTCSSGSMLEERCACWWENAWEQQLSLEGKSEVLSWSLETPLGPTHKLLFYKVMSLIRDIHMIPLTSWAGSWSYQGVLDQADVQAVIRSIYAENFGQYLPFQHRTLCRNIQERCTGTMSSEAKDCPPVLHTSSFFFQSSNIKYAKISSIIRWLVRHWEYPGIYSLSLSSEVHLR